MNSTPSSLAVVTLRQNALLPLSTQDLLQPLCAQTSLATLACITSFLCSPANPASLILELFEEFLIRNISDTALGADSSLRLGREKNSY